MVEKVINTYTYWKCKVCGNLCPTRKDARDCERRKPYKEEISITGKQYGYEWKVGDLLLIQPHDHTPKLIKIVDEKLDGHELRPIGQTAGSDEEPRPISMYDASLICVVDTKTKKQLLAILKDGE